MVCRVALYHSQDSNANCSRSGSSRDKLKKKRPPDETWPVLIVRDPPSMAFFFFLTFVDSAQELRAPQQAGHLTAVT